MKNSKLKIIMTLLESSSASPPKKIGENNVQWSIIT